MLNYFSHNSLANYHQLLIYFGKHSSNNLSTGRGAEIRTRQQEYEPRK